MEALESGQSLVGAAASWCRMRQGFGEPANFYVVLLAMGVGGYPGMGQLRTRTSCLGGGTGVGGGADVAEDLIWGKKEEMVGGCIFFSCNCIDIWVPGGMDGIRVWAGVGR